MTEKVNMSISDPRARPVNGKVGISEIEEIGEEGTKCFRVTLDLPRHSACIEVLGGDLTTAILRATVIIQAFGGEV